MEEFMLLKWWLIVAKIQMKKIWLNLSTAELQLSKKWFNSISWELLCKKIHFGKFDSWLNVDSYHHTLLYHNPMKNKTELFATETDENYSIILKIFWFCSGIEFPTTIFQQNRKMSSSPSMTRCMRWILRENVDKIYSLSKK